MAVVLLCDTEQNRIKAPLHNAAKSSHVRDLGPEEKSEDRMFLEDFARSVCVGAGCSTAGTPISSSILLVSIQVVMMTRSRTDF